MKQIGKRLGSIFLTLCMVLILMPTVTLAANAQAIKGIIEEYSNNLTATVSADGKTVTVTGEEEEATSILMLNVDSYVTVIWKAKLISASEFSRMYLIQLKGSGIFEVADGGHIESKTAAIYVYRGETVNLRVSGGTIAAKGGGDHYAIYTYGDVAVSGGIVSANTGPAISVKGDHSSLTISGGTVRSSTGSAICATGAAARVTISGGTVSNEASYASCPVINMNNADNTADNVMISGTGKVMAIASGGNGIKSYGNVTVSGNAEVSAITGGIRVQGNVTITGGKVTAQNTAIMAEGIASVVTVEGGKVNCESIGKAINAGGDNAAVIVSGGEVSSTAGNGVPIYVTGVSATVTIGGGAVIANLGNAVYISGDNALATVSGGSVSSATSTAINAEGRNAVVKINGGIVFNESTNENCPVISMSHLDNTFDNVIIGGTGKVIAKADGARAIQTCGNVMVEGNAQVCARYASICAKGTSSTVTVRGGVVFAHGSAIAGNDKVIDLPNNASGFTAPIGDGMVIAWDEDVGTVQYNIGSTDDIIFLPDTATAGWEKQSDQSGIFYANNMNTGFIPIDGVTVIKERLAVTLDELSFTDPSTLNYTYDGNPYGIGEVTAKSGVNLGTIIVYYMGIGDTNYGKSTTEPTNAGTYQVSVDVAESDDYMSASGLVLGNYTIAKAAAPSIIWPTAAGITYGHSLFDATLSGGSAEYGSFAWTDDTIIPNVTNSGFEVIFTPTALTLQNYETITNVKSIVSVIVAKAAAAGIDKTYPVLKSHEQSYIFDLTSLLPAEVDAAQVSGYIYGTHSNVNNIFSATPFVSGTTLTLPVASVAAAGLTDTVSIKFTSENYEISDAVITVETISKMPVTITADMSGGIYNGEPYAYSNAFVTDGADGSDVTGSVTLEVSYVGTGSTIYNASADAPQNAGSYQLTLSVPDSNETYFGHQSFAFVIERRPVTIKADDKSMTVGGLFPALTFTVDGQLSGETALIGEPALNCLADNTTVGNFEITVFMMGTSYTNNYMAADPAYINGTMTVRNPSSGGISGPATPPATVSGSTATTTADAKVGPDGKATAAVTQSQMSEALKKAQEAAKATGGTPNVEIMVEGASGASSVAVTIPVSSLQSLTSGGVGGLTVSSSLGSVTFGEAALRTISGAASGNVTVSVAQTDTAALPASVKQTIGTRPVYNFSVTSGSGAICQFGGAVTVSVPYTPAAGEDTNAIIIYYINDSGVLETVTNGYYDAVTGTVIFSTTHFSSYAVGYNKVIFIDVSDTAWYADPVNFLAARGVTSGTTETTFSPNAMLTRGQFITLLLRAYAIDPDNSFTDNFIDAGDTYYTGYLAAAKKLGISNGVGDNRFAPEKAITRQEMFTLLYNALKITDQLPDGDSGKTLSDFSDSGSISAYAQEAMSYLVKAGIINGNNGRLNPTDTTTRAQMAQVLYNLMTRE